MLTVIRRVALAAALPAVFAGTVLAGTATPASAIRVTASMARLEARVVKLTNKMRKHRCRAVRVDRRLRTAARYYSLDMSTRRFFGHVSPSGSTFTSRTVATGYRHPMSENLAWGYRSPRALVKAWMRSPSHRRNIVNCRARAVGVGVAYRADGVPYWTQVFGRR